MGSVVVDDHLRERFLNKVQKTDYCWLWIAYKNKYGLGSFGIGRKSYLAHRISYIIHVGQISDNQFVRHSCGNCGCVNPSHLFLKAPNEIMTNSKIEQILLSRTTKTLGCWIWNGPKNKDGYGRLDVNRKSLYTHRVSWKVYNGDVPFGLFVCHKCDNPACVNPDHLFLGDHKRNMEDCSNKGRAYNQKKTHCKHGHEFSKKNTYLKLKNGNTERVCKVCRLAHSKKYYDKISQIDL